MTHCNIDKHIQPQILSSTIISRYREKVYIRHPSDPAGIKNNEINLTVFSTVTDTR